MAWWQRLPTKESIARQQVVSEMMAKAYEAQEARSVANLQAYGKTKEYKAFAKAETIALAEAAATNEKAEDKSKSKSKAKPYAAQVNRSMANIKAYGNTKEAKAFDKAQAKAEALERDKAEAINEKSKPKSKSKGKAKAKAKPKLKAKAKVTDAQKICKLKAVVNGLKFDLRLASDDKKAKEIRWLTDTLRRVREQLRTAKAKNAEAAIQIRGADAIIEMLRAGQINCQ